ncbi:ABC transporter permease [Methanomassiliicoccus luminyensis]|uniref:ABC transporter permease n=1 Tax=Methanomassiliicoccus luminyensis TaxID=1080712 RepID=UPI00036A25E3|nr:ABC transporter permease [Methanomassiliicoccus luminyensis]
MATVNERGPGAGERRFGGARSSLAPVLRERRRWFAALRKNRLAMAGLALVLFILAIAVAAPLLAPPVGDGNPLEVPKDMERPALPKPPGAQGIIDGKTTTFIFGTGQYGEDIYYGIVWGARTSLYISMAVVGAALLLGIAVGALAGYRGGLVDEVLMRLTDVFMALPALIMALAIVAVLGNSIENVILALVITWWPAYARIMRGQVMSVKNSGYVEAARAIGAGRGRILFRHIVPNSISPLMVQATMDIGMVVLVAAALSFIGFNHPDMAEWGRMVASGQSYILSQVPYPYPDGAMHNPWWMWAIPGAFIFIMVMGFNLLGEGLRDAMDPRRVKRR